MLHQLSKRIITYTRALIILPTRDLAYQTYKVLLPYVKAIHLKSMVIYGENSFIKEQIALKEDIPDILIATPGRLIDHINNNNVILKYLNFFIIDEADRLLSQHYFDWLNTIYNAISHNKFQKLIISATLTRDPAKLIQLKLHNPAYYSLNIKEMYTFPKQLIQQYIVINDESNKPQSLLSLLKNTADDNKSTDDIPQTVIFTSSINSTHRLYRLLEILHYNVAEFSSILTQKQRNKIILQFKQKKINILICSDVMARGMDIESIEKVINYDAPMFLKTYMHRVGRTARANRSGIALTLLLAKQVRSFKNMLASIHALPLLNKLQINNKKINEINQHFHQSLFKLKQVLNAEQTGLLKNDIPLSKQKVWTNEISKEQIDHQNHL